MKSELPVVARTDHQLLVEIHGMLSGELKPENAFPSLLKSAEQLNGIVEGCLGKRWSCDGQRLVDTKEWCEFYVQLSKFRKK